MSVRQPGHCLFDFSKREKVVIMNPGDLARSRRGFIHISITSPYFSHTRHAILSPQ